MLAPRDTKGVASETKSLQAQLAQFEREKQQQQQQRQRQQQPQQRPQQQQQIRVGAQSRLPVKQKQTIKWSKYVVPSSPTQQDVTDTLTTTSTIGGHLNLLGFTSSDCSPEFWTQCEEHAPTICHFPKVSNGVVPVCKECTTKMGEREDLAAPIGPKQGTCIFSSDCIYCCLGQDPKQVHIMGYTKHMDGYCGDDEYCNGDDYYSPIGGNSRPVNDTRVHPIERKPLILTGLRDRPPFILIVNNPTEQDGGDHVATPDHQSGNSDNNDTIGPRDRHYGGGGGGGGRDYHHGGGGSSFGTGVALGALGATALGMRTPYYYYPPSAPYYYDGGGYGDVGYGGGYGGYGGYSPYPYYYRRRIRPYPYVLGKQSTVGGREQQQQQKQSSFSASFAIQPIRSNSKSAQEVLDLVGVKTPKQYAKATYNKVKEVFVNKPTRLGGKKWLKKKVSSLGYYVDPRRVASWRGGPGDSSSHWWYTGNNLQMYRPTGRKWPVVVLGLPEAQGPNVVVYSSDMALPRCVAVDVTTGIPCPNAVDPEDICPGCGQQHYCTKEHAHYVAAVQLATKYKRGYNPSSFLYYCPIKREIWEGAL